MNLAVLYQMVLADFRERTRRYSFLVLLGSNVFLAYLVFAGRFTPRLGNYSGEPNSAWTGATVSLTCSVMLLMFAFFVIRNTINRDRDSGVGQVLAATRLGKTAYLYGKFMSNVALLYTLVAVIGVSEAVMQLVWGTDFNPAGLWAPLIWLTLPIVTVIAGVAVFFESISWLRGGLGNVVFFLLAMAMMPIGIESEVPMLDLWGFRLFESSMITELHRYFPEAPRTFVLNPGLHNGLRTFPWTGIEWTWDVVRPHLYWFGIAAVFPVLGLPFFNRFDEQRSLIRRRRAALPEESLPDIRPVANVSTGWSVQLQPLGETLRHAWPALVLGELRLMLKSVPRIWHLVALGMIAAQLASPITVVLEYLVPLAWVWPIVMWSGMGALPHKHNTLEILACAPSPPARRLAACWAAGAVVALLIGGSGLIRAAVVDNGSFGFSLAAGVCFVPSMGLALGVFSRTRRLFEVVYMTVWYIGPLNRMPYLDFLGLTAEARAVGIPSLFTCFGLALLAAAMIRFRRETDQRSVTA